MEKRSMVETLSIEMFEQFLLENEDKLEQMGAGTRNEDLKLYQQIFLAGWSQFYEIQNSMMRSVDPDEPNASRIWFCINQMAMFAANQLTVDLQEIEFKSIERVEPNPQRH
jgi:hypothetical protein